MTRRNVQNTSACSKVEPSLDTGTIVRQVCIVVWIETKPMDQGTAVVKVCITVAQTLWRALFLIQSLV